MIAGELASQVQRLLDERTAFVVATVVRARHPTSVRPGDAAVVLGDGTIEGFVGGVCAQSSVRLHSLRALETGDPLLLRLVPDDGPQDAGGLGSEPLEGAVVERNPCLSGGAMEIFLEPHLPPARLVVVGGSPIAEAVGRLADAAGYTCERAGAGDGLDVTGAGAVVVSSHGSNEEGVLEAALRAGVPYVALVASRRRGAAVRESLDVADELRAQLHTPAGLDIGARTPAEIAISILAELVSVQHRDPAPGGGLPMPAAVVAVATDPVCGMQVAATPAAVSMEGPDGPVYFCSDHCRSVYAAQHAPR